MSLQSVQWKPSCSSGQVDEWTDITKPTVAFYSFVNLQNKKMSPTILVVLRKPTPTLHNVTAVKINMGCYAGQYPLL